MNLTAVVVFFMLSIAATSSSDVGCRGVIIRPGDDIQSELSGNPPGTTFCFQPGLYRIATALVPQAGQSLVSTVDRAAVLDGSKVVSGFTPSGSNFVAKGFLPLNPSHHGVCLVQGCWLVQDVFVDGAPLKRVLRISALHRGAFYEDFKANRIYLRDDPTGHLVEQAFASNLIWGRVSSQVTVRGFVIQKTANAAQTGAIDAQGISGWVIENNEIRFNHGTGVIADESIVRGNFVHHNGQLGVSGNSSPHILVEHNEISFNNTAGYSGQWEAGGAKWALTEYMIVRDNYVHDNAGIGLWCDINCYDTTFEGNVVNDNFQTIVTKQLTYRQGAGIMYEISDKALIRGNRLARNGAAVNYNGFFDGAQILIADSPNVDVTGNAVRGIDGIGILQQRRSDACHHTYPDGTPACIENIHQDYNVDVHDNTVTETGAGQVAGLDEDISDKSPFQEKHNRFERNHYCLPDRLGEYFAWFNTPQLNTREQWQAYGQDVHGTFDCSRQPLP